MVPINTTINSIGTGNMHFLLTHGWKQNKICKFFDNVRCVGIETIIFKASK